MPLISTAGAVHETVAVPGAGVAVPGAVVPPVVPEVVSAAAAEEPVDASGDPLSHPNNKAPMSAIETVTPTRRRFMGMSKFPVSRIKKNRASEPRWCQFTMREKMRQYVVLDRHLSANGYIYRHNVNCFEVLGTSDGESAHVVQ
jgi:hypothetical protein